MPRPARERPVEPQAGPTAEPRDQGEGALVDEPTDPNVATQKGTSVRHQEFAPPAVAEMSIIVDDVALNEATEAPDATDLLTPDDASEQIETFLSEMNVLIKYGHAVQVPGELERWLRDGGDDLGAHLRVAEFERAGVDAVRGLDRLFWVASSALDAGDRAMATRVIAMIARAAPEDRRRAALEKRVGEH